MSNYLIGDVHGYFDELRALLAQVNFDPQQDTVWLTGDLVARGPGSLEVLQYVRSLGSAARIVLGNHDLHLLAVHADIYPRNPEDHITSLLEAPDIDELINWLRHQPLLQVDKELKLIMVHAGISPQWNLETAQRCAREVETVLRHESYPLFLGAMYGDTPNSWSLALSHQERIRFSTNVLTRMRLCFHGDDGAGALDLKCKGKPEDAPDSLKPWFDLPSLVDPEYAIVFGHWGELAGKGTPRGIYALDTGCCWGGPLTLLRWEDKRYFTQAPIR